MELAKGKLVQIGTSVTVRLHGTVRTITLVVHEAEPSKGLISVHSPLGKMLLGRGEREEFVFNSPSGPQRCEVLKIH